jgi:hypothetical protein
VRYDNTTECRLAYATNLRADPLLPALQTSSCQVVLNVTADLKGPVFIYYKIDNFYQNNRKYIISINQEQLMD